MRNDWRPEWINEVATKLASTPYDDWIGFLDECVERFADPRIKCAVLEEIGREVSSQKPLIAEERAAIEILHGKYRRKRPIDATAAQ